MGNNVCERWIISSPFSQVSQSFYRFLHANYQVRKLITELLEVKASFSKCEPCRRRSGFELAFCYMLGFGISLDAEKALYWAEHFQFPMDLLKAEITLLEHTPGPFNNKSLNHKGTQFGSFQED